MSETISPNTLYESLQPRLQLVNVLFGIIKAKVKTITAGLEHVQRVSIMGIRGAIQFYFWVYSIMLRNVNYWQDTDKGCASTLTEKSKDIPEFLE